MLSTSQVHKCTLPTTCLEPRLLTTKRWLTTFKFALEVETLTPFDSIKVAPERLSQLQKCTAQDLVLEMLKTTVLTGWPEKIDQCPVQVRDYWNYREEISLHNGLLFKSQRVILFKAMRSEILSKIHSSHQGIVSCLRKAKDITC